ncbi:hypothetical protein BZA02_103427 [Ruegeria sp. P4]|nr:hypothetical protein BZA02_103427 [Ruegeria sp. P4]
MADQGPQSGGAQATFTLEAPAPASNLIWSIRTHVPLMDLPSKIPISP